MLLVWGRKWYTRKEGFVADFCEICRRPQAFTLERLTLKGHFWYLPLGRTHAVRHQGRCTQCATEMETEQTRYAQVVKKASGSTRELLATTLPNHERVLQPRMEAERTVRDNLAGLPAAARRDLLARPFVTLSPMVEQRFATMHFDLWAGLAMASVLVLPVLLQALFAIVSPDDKELGMLVGLALGLVLVFVAAFGAKRRWIRKFVVPRLDDALKPMQASGAEISGIIGELKQHKHKLGKYLKPADLKARGA
jgi:hypothetical protein